MALEQILSHSMLIRPGSICGGSRSTPPSGSTVPMTISKPQTTLPSNSSNMAWIPLSTVFRHFVASLYQAVGAFCPRVSYTSESSRVGTSSLHLRKETRLSLLT